MIAPNTERMTDSDADHRPHLPSFHTHRPQEPDLVGPLEDREHERVHNADEGDHDGQRQEGVDQRQELVDLGSLRFLEAGPGLDLQIGIRMQTLLHHVGHALAVALRLHEYGHRQWIVEVIEEEAIPHEIAPDEGVGLEDPTDAQCGRTRLSELDRHDRPHRQMLRVRRRGVDEQLSGREGGCAGPTLHAENDRRREVLGGDSGQVGQRMPDGEGPLIDGGDRCHSRQRGRDVRHRTAELTGTALGGARDDVARTDCVVDAARDGLRERGAEHGDG